MLNQSFGSSLPLDARKQHEKKKKKKFILSSKCNEYHKRNCSAKFNSWVHLEQVRQGKHCNPQLYRAHFQLADLLQDFVNVFFFIYMLHRSNQVSTLQLPEGKMASSRSINVVKYSVYDCFSCYIAEEINMYKSLNYRWKTITYYFI